MTIRTKLDDVRAYANSWVFEYLNIVWGSRMPPEFLLLSGMWALGVVLGTKGRVYRETYWLYPMLNVFTIAHSGSGKSATLKLAMEVLKGVKDDLPHLWCLTQETFTRRGFLMQAEAALRTPEGMLDHLHGGFGVHEATSIFRSRVGTENNKEFMIQVVDGEEINEATAAHGIKHFPGFRIGTFFCSTITMMRQCMTGEDFANGLLARWIPAVDTRKGTQYSDQVDTSGLLALGKEAIKLANKAPNEFVLSPAADDWCRTEANLFEQKADNNPLSGIWNRFVPRCIQVAINNVLGDGRDQILVEDLERAKELLEVFQSAIEPLYEQLSQEGSKVRAFDQLDVLENQGFNGMALAEFRRKLPGMGRANQEVLEWIFATDLAVQGEHNGKRWVWRTAAFRDGPPPLEVRDA